MLPTDRMARGHDADCSARTQSGSGRAGCRYCLKERGGWCRRGRERASRWRRDPGGLAAVQAEGPAFDACRRLAASQDAGLLAPAREHRESLERKPSPQEDAPLSSLTPRRIVWRPSEVIRNEWPRPDRVAPLLPLDRCQKSNRLKWKPQMPEEWS